MSDPMAGSAFDQAARWVAIMDKGGWSASSEAELQAWLAGDPQRRGALLQAQASWLALKKRPVVEERPRPNVAADPCEPLSPVAPSQSLSIGRRTLIGVGAGLAASIVAGIAYFDRRIDLRTGLGEIRRVPLPDGSIAAINTGSEVEVGIAERRRDITLKTGEAWFQVAHNPDSPFLVVAGATRVLAVGTAFSVRKRANGTDVVVTEGVVEVWSESGARARTRLRQGQSAFLSDAGIQDTTVLADGAPDRALAWRSGRIELMNERLDSAISEFNRYNTRQLVLADQALASLRLGGYFRTDDIEGFAKAVNATLGVPVNLDALTEIQIGRKGGST